MTPKVAIQVEAIQDMTVAELRDRYAEVFGENTRSRHKDFLRKRITWRPQANEEGGLSDRALRRAEKLAKDSDLRLIAPRHMVTRPFRPSGDRRLPMPGTVLTREYRGQTVSVTVLDEGFEYGGTVYRSLTAVAKVITGSHWNGYGFFRDSPQGRQAVTTRTARQNRQTTPPLTKQVRCAVYTRKSTDEGLEQEFNSLDAQRGAAEALIASQRHEGWTCLPDRYDLDPAGGRSGSGSGGRDGVDGRHGQLRAGVGEPLGWVA